MIGLNKHKGNVQGSLNGFLFVRKIIKDKYMGFCVILRL